MPPSPHSKKTQSRPRKLAMRVPSKFTLLPAPTRREGLASPFEETPQQNTSLGARHISDRLLNRKQPEIE